MQYHAKPTIPSEPPIIVAGSGIGGLSAAIALQRLSKPVVLVEKLASFAELGAGIQLGPNVWFCLREWGLESALRNYACFPSEVVARNAVNGKVISRLKVAGSFEKRYGGPYCTIHRADLHRVLHEHAAQQQNIQIVLNHRVQGFTQEANQPIQLQIQTPYEILNIEADMLIGADGVRSIIREKMLCPEKGTAEFSGHLAYRGLIHQTALPQHLRSNRVTTWLGPKMHAVVYPIRRNELLNIVLLVEANSFQDRNAYDDWDWAAHSEDVLALSKKYCSHLANLLQAVSSHGYSHDGKPWRLWPLNGRPPLQNANQMAQQRVALLGDAAHPMLPFLAQGAGMAIEDAYQLQQSLALPQLSVQEQLLHYAKVRYARNAKVQKQALRNGRIFNATGPLRLARDSALAIAGSHLMDTPWLYKAQWKKTTGC